MSLQDRITEAVVEQDVEKIKKLLLLFPHNGMDDFNKKDEMDEKNDFCINMLTFCIYAKNYELFAQLCGCVDINSRGPTGRTILTNIIDKLEGAFNRHEIDSYSEIEEGISFILNFIGDIIVLDHINVALHYYICILIDNEIEINEKRKNIIVKMLELGTDIYYVHEDGDCSIITSAVESSVEILEIILENAYVDGVKGIKNVQISMLYDAINLCYPYDIIELLLRHVNIDEIDISRLIGDIINDDVRELLIENGVLP